MRGLHVALTDYFAIYNNERTHQSLNYRTPAEEYFVLLSALALSNMLALIFLISWSSHWGQP